MNHPSRIIVIGLLGCALSACGSTSNPPASQGASNTALAAATTAPVVTTAAAAAVPTIAAPAATALPAATLTATDMSSATTGDAGKQGVTETVHVVVAGGPHAGTYDKSVPDGGCSYGFAGAGSWDNQYSDANEKADFSSLQLVVPNAKEAAAGTSKFLTTFTFGGLTDPSATNYNIDGRDNNPPKGKGTVTVDDKGNTAVVTLHAEPQPDVKIDATITCDQVVRDTSPGPTPASDTSATEQSDATDDSMATATP